MSEDASMQRCAALEAQLVEAARRWTEAAGVTTLSVAIPGTHPRIYVTVGERERVIDLLSIKRAGDLPEG
jgi:hypothetical protein